MVKHRLALTFCLFYEQEEPQLLKVSKIKNNIRTLLLKPTSAIWTGLSRFEISGVLIKAKNIFKINTTTNIQEEYRKKFSRMSSIKCIFDEVV